MPEHGVFLTCTSLLESDLCQLLEVKGYYRVIKMKLNARKKCCGDMIYDIKFSMFL